MQKCNYHDIQKERLDSGVLKKSQEYQNGISWIACAFTANIFGPCVKDFGPINIYTLFVYRVCGKKVREISVNHNTNLEKLFPDNELIKDKESKSNQ